MRSAGPFVVTLLHASFALGGVVRRQDDQAEGLVNEELPVVNNKLVTPEDEEKIAGLDQTWKEKFDANQFCNKYDPQEKEEDAQKVWDEFKINEWFTGWLEQTTDISDWTKVMDKEMHRNGGSQFYCAQIDDTCDPPADCRLHYDNGMGPAYWILQASSRYHSIAKAFKTNLENSKSDQIFKVDEMIEDFGLNRNEPSLNLFGILNGAFTIAAGLTAPAAPVSGALSVIAGALGIAASFSDEEYVTDPSIEFEKQVYEGYDKTIEGLKKVVHETFSPDPIQLPQIHVPIPVDSIPGGSAKSVKGNSGLALTVQSLVDRFAKGKFLFDDWENQVTKIHNDYVSWHRAALVQRMLKKKDFVVVVNTDVKENQCKLDHAYWDGNRCFRTVQHVYGLKCDIGPSLRKWNGGYVDTASEKYGLGDKLKEYYQSSYDCAKAHPDGDGEPPASSDVGKGVPQCFFNMPVIEGSFKSYGGAGLRLDGEATVNTLSDKGCGGYDYNCVGRNDNCRVRGPGKDWDPLEKDLDSETKYLATTITVGGSIFGGTIAFGG